MPQRDLRRPSVWLLRCRSRRSAGLTYAAECLQRLRQSGFHSEAFAEVLHEIQPGLGTAFQVVEDRSTVRRDPAGFACASLISRPTKLTPCPVQQPQLLIQRHRQTTSIGRTPCQRCALWRMRLASVRRDTDRILHRGRSPDRAAILSMCFLLDRCQPADFADAVQNAADQIGSRCNRCPRHNRGSQVAAAGLVLRKASQRRTRCPIYCSGVPSPGSHPAG